VDYAATVVSKIERVRMGQHIEGIAEGISDPQYKRTDYTVSMEWIVGMHDVGKSVDLTDDRNSHLVAASERHTEVDAVAAGYSVDLTERKENLCQHILETETAVWVEAETV
jgi:hypothetical protein